MIMIMIYSFNIEHTIIKNKQKQIIINQTQIFISKQKYAKKNIITINYKKNLNNKKINVNIHLINFQKYRPIYSKMQSTQTLQKKQQYLRTHIDQEKYDDFYQFCQNVLGTVDINAWTYQQTTQNVSKFNQYFQKRIQKILVKYSYGEYQSRQGENINQHNAQESEMSECVSSRVAKSSAVEFLDQILQQQSHSSVKTQPKNTNYPTTSNINLNYNNNNIVNVTTPSHSQRTSTQQRPMSHNLNTGINLNLPTTNINPVSKTPPATTKNTTPVSFDQFDFWTSSLVTNPPTPKISTQIRNKSTSEYRTNKLPTTVISSPQPNSKNNYNNNPLSQYFDINLNQVKQTKPRAQTQQITHNQNQHQNQQIKPQNQSSIEFDFFNTGTLNVPVNTNTNTYGIGNGNGNTNPNKNSPYLKKQFNQLYEVKNTPSNTSGIRLKQIRQLKQNPRGMSVNIDQKHNNNSQVQAQGQVIFDTTLQCYKQAVRNQLADRNFNVYFDKHEIIERKFLASDYAMYSIKIVPLNIQIKRNYEDYTRLKSTLQKMYPGVQLPYLEQLSWLSSTSQPYIANQKKMLQFFTRDLLRNKQIRNSVVLEDFLTLRDHKAIKRKFQKYLQIQPLKGLEDLCFLDGKVHITLSSAQKKYIQNLESFLSKMNQYYTRYQKLTETLIQQHFQIMKTYKFIISLLQEQQNYIKQFNTKTTINNIKNLGNSIKIIRQTYKQQLSSTKFDHEVQIKKVMPFLKYQRNNFMELQKLIDVEKKLQRSYDKRSLSQKIPLNQFYNSQSVKGTKNGILTQSTNLTVLKHQVGYLGYQTRNQGQRIFDELGVKNISRWQSLGQMYLNKLTNSIDFWKNITKLQKQKFQTQLTF